MLYNQTKVLLPLIGINWRMTVGNISTAFSLQKSELIITAIIPLPDKQVLT